MTQLTQFEQEFIRRGWQWERLAIFDTFVGGPADSPIFLYFLNGRFLPPSEDRTPAEGDIADIVGYVDRLAALYDDPRAVPVTAAILARGCKVLTALNLSKSTLDPNTKQLKKSGHILLVHDPAFKSGQHKYRSVLVDEHGVVINSSSALVWACQLNYMLFIMTRKYERVLPEDDALFGVTA